MKRFRAARNSHTLSGVSSTKKTKHRLLVAAVVAIFLLVVYAGAVRPSQDARSYTGRLESASKPLDACFQKLSDTTQLDIYGAPDISLDAKQKDITKINQQISECRNQLDIFDGQAHKLLQLHFAGFTQTYHQAQVDQRQAYDVIGQSQDVLSQYSDLTSFLSQYYSHLEAFSAYYQNLQQIESGYSGPSAATVKVLSQQAGDLHKRAGLVRALSAPPGFEATKTATASMLDNIANGFDNAVKGYSSYSDYYVNLGLGQADDAVADYDNKVINMPFDQLQISYIPKQVQQLPVKIENLLAAQSE